MKGKKVILVLLMTFQTVYSQEFLVKNHSTRARGMGGAVIAIADDLVGGWWNPAGIAQQSHFSVQAEISMENYFLTSDIDFDKDAYKYDKWNYWPPEFLGIILPKYKKFNLFLGYESVVNFYKKYQNTEFLSIQNGHLGAFSVGLSYQILENLSAGIGINFYKGFREFDYKELSQIKSPVPEYNEKFTYKGGHNHSFGIHYKILPFKFGIIYQMDYKLTELDNAHDYKAILTMPAIVGLGMAYQIQRFLFAIDFEKKFYSQFDREYKRAYGPYQENEKEPNDFIDIKQLRWGSEYSNKFKEVPYSLRFGVATVPTGYRGMDDKQIKGKLIASGIGIEPLKNLVFNVGIEYQSFKYILEILNGDIYTENYLTLFFTVQYRF